MRPTVRLALEATAVLLCLAGPAVAETQPDAPQPYSSAATEEALSVPLKPPVLKGTLAEDVKVNLNLELLNLFLLRNDADFDRTDAYYDKYGQSEGVLASFLAPRLTIEKGDFLTFFYASEIGTDLWSATSADESLDSSERSISLKQREIWGRVQLGDFFVKAGFQRFADTSGLFINHWIGAARFGYGCEQGTHITASVGQLPDQTFEGWEFGSAHMGSFKDDVTLVALDGRVRLNDNLNLDAGLYYMRDGSVIDHTRQVGTATATFSANYRTWLASASVAAQFGAQENAAADGTDTGLLAFAASANGTVNLGQFQLKANLVALSPDDDSQGNDSTGFLWSGKRPGQAVLLNENQTRDIGDNIDERLGVFDGLFYDMQTGIAGGDLGLYMQTLRWLKLGVVTSGLMTLNQDNSMGSRFVGWENELVAGMTALDGLFETTLTGGVLLPGEAGAAFSNELPDRTATDPLYFVYLTLAMRL